MNITKYSTMLNEKRTVQLVEEAESEYDEGDLNSPEKIARMLNQLYGLDMQTEEYVYLIAFNAKYRPIGVFELSHGVVNASQISPREVFMKAVICNATSVVIAHNHPSGDPTPSDEDKAVYGELLKASEVLCIYVADFIIVGDAMLIL